MSADSTPARPPGDGDVPGEAVDLLYDVAHLCNMPSSLPTLGRHVLRRVCRFNGWVYGVIHLGETADGNVLSEHHDPGWSFDPGGDVARAMTGTRERVLAEVTPVWDACCRDPDGRELTVLAAPVASPHEVFGLCTFVAGHAPFPPGPARRAIEAVTMMLGGAIEQRRLNRLIDSATSGERARIGRDMHDSVCQSLAGIALSLDGLSHRLGSAEGAEQAGRLAADLRESIERVRAIVSDLTPYRLRGETFADTLQRAVSRASAAYDARCRVVECPRTLPASVAAQLELIAGEAVTNAARHAVCTTIEVGCRIDGDTVVLTVRDDGTGLKDTSAMSGCGMAIMRHRASMIDGDLSVVTSPGQGTTVRCEVPMSRFRRGEDEQE